MFTAFFLQFRLRHFERALYTLLLAIVLLGFISPRLHAETGTGAVAGKVLDDATGNYLEGAEIVVQGTDLRTNSGRSGVFTFSGLATGPQTLLVTYPGLAPKTETVQVTSGAPVEIVVHLAASDVVQLSEFRVSSAKEGMAQAIALQKVSVQSKLVAAADQFGEVSEGNIGEYLKFLPGVSVDYNVNDARGLSLRGLSTTFTIVAVDGTPMAGTSSMDDTRRFEFEQIAMNNVETTELYKTVTPDIPASSTGGFVNFVTKSAFDSSDIQRISYNVSFSAPSTNLSASRKGGVWGDKKEYTVRPSLELNLARRVNSKLGVNFNYRLSEKYDDSPRTTVGWNVQLPSATVGPNTIFTAQPRLGTYAIRSEEKLTHREAFATKIDYLISDATKLSLSGQWNWYDLHFTQRGPTFLLGVNGTVSGDTYVSGSGAGVNGLAGSIQNGVLYRNKYGTTYHANGTLTHDFSPNSKMSLTSYYSRADGQYRDTNKGFISSVAVLEPLDPQSTAPIGYTTIVLTGVRTQELPTVTLLRNGAPVSFDYARDLSNYTLKNAINGTNFQSRPWSALDTKKGVSGNYTYDMDLSVPIKLETGFAFDDVKRYTNRPDYRGAIPNTTGAALTALMDPNYTRDVAFGFGSYQVVDPYKVWDTFKSKLTFVATDDVRNVHEQNDAGFLRADVNVMPDLLLTGGARWEKHTMDGQAQNRANGRSKLSHVNLDYASLYPSLSLKYTPKAHRAVVLRAGVSRTVGHPDYADILSTILSESAPGAGDGSITVPSTNLKPYYSNNFDLSVDFYLKNSGVIGVYGYMKKVENYFISRGMSRADINVVATDYGYNPAEFSSGAVTENGGKSTLTGVELSYAQNLSFLPKPFNGLSVQANFTYLDVSVKDPNPMRALDLEYSQLRAVSPKTANFILSYRYRAFSIMSTTNWVSESLFGGFVASSYFTGFAGTSTTPDTRLAIYRDEKATTDIKVEYAINKNASVYFLVRNIFNSQRVDYFRGYLPEHRDVVLPDNRYEFGEPHLTLGVRGRF